MNVMQILFEGLVSDGFTLAVRHEHIRLQMFLEWLKSHSSMVKAVEQVHIQVAVRGQGMIDGCRRNNVKRWFESILIQGLHWECHLIPDEINCWRNLDPRSLTAILKPEGRA